MKTKGGAVAKVRQKDRERKWAKERPCQKMTPRHPEKGQGRMLRNTDREKAI